MASDAELVASLRAGPGGRGRTRLRRSAVSGLGWLLDPFRAEGLDLLVESASWLEASASSLDLRLVAEVSDEHDGGQTVAWIERLVSAGEAWQRNTLTYEPFRKRGIARRILSATVALYDRLGVRRVRTIASGDGRYAWARCGFDFAESFGSGSAGPPPALEAARALAGRLGYELGGVAHSWEVAGRSEPLPPGALPGHDGESLGRVLLLCSGTDAWEGVLDLGAGSPSRAQFERYCRPARAGSGR